MATTATALDRIFSPDASTDAIARIIEEDPSLARHVIKLANSALFAGHWKVQSVRQAIVRLGTRQVANTLFETMS